MLCQPPPPPPFHCTRALSQTRSRLRHHSRWGSIGVAADIENAVHTTVDWNSSRHSHISTKSVIASTDQPLVWTCSWQRFYRWWWSSAHWSLNCRSSVHGRHHHSQTRHCHSWTINSSWHHHSSQAAWLETVLAFGTATADLDLSTAVAPDWTQRWRQVLLQLIFIYIFQFFCPIKRHLNGNEIHALRGVPNGHPELT